PLYSLSLHDALPIFAQVASKYGGLYATHIRSEGASEMQALAEAIRIGREANLPVEVFHLKVSGKPRWGNMKNVVATIQSARDSGDRKSTRLNSSHLV